MRIEGWSVQAFGHLRGHDLGGLRPGVNVVLGPNESGKTTLLHFLRWVLFGFPHHNSIDYKRYRPDAGAFGGRVRVVHNDRVVVVERHAGDTGPTLTDERGHPVGDLVWSDVVGTAQLALFESVFAITVDQLRGFDDLDATEVQEHIYAASIGGGRSAREVLATLDDDRKVLLSPRKGTIRQLGLDLREEQQALAAARHEAAALPTRRCQVSEMHDEVRRLGDSRDEISSRARQVRKLVEWWPTCSQADHARRERDQLPPAVDLPPDPLTGLTSFLRQADQARGDLDQADAALETTRAALDAITVNDTIAEVTTEAHRLDRQMPVTDSGRSQLTTRATELRQRETQLRERLAELGPDWTADRVAGIDTSLVTLGDIERLTDQIRSTDETHTQAAVAVGTARHTRDGRQGELTGAQRERAAVQARTTDVADTRAARYAAQQLRRLLPRLEAQRQGSGDRQRFDRLIDDLKSGATAPTVPTWLAPALAVGAAASGAGALLAFVTAAPAPGVLLILLAVGLVVAAVTVRRAATPHVGLTPAAAVADASGNTDPSDNTGPSDNTSLSDNADASDAEATLEGLVTQVTAAAQTAGLQGEPSIETVDERLGDLDRELDLAEQATTQTAHLRQAQQALDDAERSEKKAGAEVETAAAHWQTWLARQQLPPNLAPEAAAPFIDRVRGAHKAVTDHEASHEQVEQLKETIDAHDAELNDLLIRAEVADADDPSAALARLITSVADDGDARKRREELQERQPAVEAARQRAADHLAEAEQVLTDLFTAAGADDADVYRHVVGIEGRRADLDRRISDTELELRGAFGDDGSGLQARATLATGDVTQWENEAEQLEIRLAQTGEAHEEAVRVHQDAITELEDLETSADVARHSLKTEALRSELEEAIEQWTVASLAHRAVHDTLKRFERERQPEVVSRAAESFGRITGDRYAGLIPDGSSLDLLLPNDARLDAELLSRGATEQLYLSMRFALALQYAAKTPLPLVLDDVLVNADHERRPRLADELIRLGEDIQVLLFTCHPETAALLGNCRSDTTVVELGI